MSHETNLDLRLSGNIFCPSGRGGYMFFIWSEFFYEVIKQSSLTVTSSTKFAREVKQCGLTMTAQKAMEGKFHCDLR